MPTMKANLRAEVHLVNRNLDEIIRLVERATDAGIWTRHEAERHERRIESLRAKLNADFRELMALRERANTLRLSTQNAHPLTKKKG
jgi:predicted RNase H-like nuclease (RuvC/YqgF family)